jgi:hypothetical protein
MILFHIAFALSGVALNIDLYVHGKRFSRGVESYIWSKLNIRYRASNVQEHDMFKYFDIFSEIL